MRAEDDAERCSILRYPYTWITLQVCRDLYSFLSTREVWTRVLRSASRRHGVFLPTDPVSEAGMTIGQIQRAASRPERWRNLVCRRAAPLGLWGENPPTPQDLDEHPTITPTSERASFPLRSWRLHLVPGGRFLVVLALPADHSRWFPAAPTTVVLSIYDLGNPGTTENDVPSIVASHSFDIACTMINGVHTAKSGVVVMSESSLRVVVVYPIEQNSMAPAVQWQ